MRESIVKRIGYIFSLLVFLTALYLLDREFKSIHYHQVLYELRQLPLSHILLSIAWAMFSYLMLSGYDLLALRYIKHPLSFPRVALASFVSTAFSQTLGFVVGAPMRYRLYTAWGLSAIETTKLVLFGYMTFWLGHFAMSGVALVLDSKLIPEILHLPIPSLFWLGIAMVAGVAGYLVLTKVTNRTIVIRRWEFALPSFGLSIAQLVVASLDWIAAGAVLYVLLPPSEVTFPAFFIVFMLGHAAGIVSQVPGGVGVFETVTLLLLSSKIPSASIIGALVAYRAIYYLFPVGLAAILAGVIEGVRIRERLKPSLQVFSNWFSSAVPQTLAVCSSLGGIVLLVSGATPPVHGRMRMLEMFIPLPVVELSHFLASVAGVGLLLLARGLQRRLDAVYYLTALLLASGIGLSLLKGWDYEEAIILALMLTALIPCHRYFHRKSSLLSEPLSAGWILTVILVLVSSIWLGLFSFKRVQYSNDLWWQFALHGDASRFLRASVGVVITSMMFGLARLMRPSAIRVFSFPSGDELKRAAEIASDSPRTSANLVRLGDKSLLFNEKRDTFIMYGTEGSSCIAMGDPVGPREEHEEIIWNFRELCEHYGVRSIFYQIGPENLPYYIDLGLTLVKLGEIARVPLVTFGLEGPDNKKFRHAHERAIKSGCSFEIVPVESVPLIFPQLRAISDSWLADKKTREKGFSLGFYTEDYLRNFSIALVKFEDRPVAFANIWIGGGKEEFSVDLMRFGADAPAGAMDFMFIRLMLWGREAGFKWFDLGMAPLSGLGEHSQAPLWSKLGAFAFRHGEQFYNFQGLRAYKDKFHPEWEPRYLAAPGGLSLPIVLSNTASLISRGTTGVIAK